MNEYILESVRSAAGYQPGMQPTQAVAKLNTNELPFSPSPNVARAIRDSVKNLNRYPEPDSSSLCRAAAGVYGLSQDCVLACNGGDEGLSVVMRTMIAKNDRILTLTPTYPFYATLASLQGATIEAMTLSDLSSKRKPDDIKLTILARPNSPCGKVIDREIIANWQGPLLVDEAYIEFSQDSVVDLIAHKPDLMILRTLSKAYGLAGLRIGFILSQPEIIQQLKKVRGVYTVDRLAMAAGIAALDDQDYLTSTVDSIAGERIKLLAALRSLGYTLEDSSTNFLWIPSFDLFTFERLAKQGIYIRALSTTKGVGARITVGTREQNNALISALKMIRDQSLR